MQSPPPLEYISQLIQTGYFADAQRGLNAILEVQPTHAAAWALAAWIAPDSERCNQALHQVVYFSQDARLKKWAKRGLVLIEHTGALDEEMPPMPFLRWSAVAQSADPDSDPTVPKPRGAGYGVSQAGGAIMLGGTLVIALAIIFKPFADMLNSTIGVGTCGFGLLIVGGIIALVGYRRSRAS